MEATSRNLALLLVTSVSLAAMAVGCSDEPAASVPDHHDESAEAAEDENLGTTSSALTAKDTVAMAVTQTCTTASVKGLAQQLVEEVQCLRPNTFMRIDKTPGLALGSAVFPYLQTNAAKALVAAQKVRNQTLSLNSGLRTLPQQFLLYRWYQTGRCGIPLAASPGTSNHESAVAVDINESAAWRSAMQGKGFRWLGANDPVHYDFVGGGTVDMRGLSVRAFQRLWNRNHPTDKIAEDGSYCPATAAKIAASPIGGFPIGAVCPPKEADAGADAGGSSEPGETKPTDIPAVPDGPEPEEGTPASPEGTSNESSSGLPPLASDESGCSVGTTRSVHVGTGGLCAAGIALMALAARRRRPRR